MTSINRNYPLTPRSLRRLSLMQRCYELGESEQRGTLLWRTGTNPWSEPWVSFGLNRLIESVDGFRVHPSILTSLKEKDTFSDDFIERLRSARAVVDIAGVEEGDLICSQTMLLELEGSNFNCMLVASLAEHFVGTATEVASRAFALRRSHKKTKLALQSRQDEFAETALAAAKMTGWDGVDAQQRAQEHSWTHFEPNASSVRFSDPAEVVEQQLSSSWPWEWTSLSADYEPYCADLTLVQGTSSRRTYRLLNADGTRLDDLEQPTGTKVLQNMRKVVQRYADRGHPCRPLPDPMRIRALHERATFEFGF